MMLRRGLGATLFGSTMLWSLATVVMPTEPTCDLEVRQNGASISWRCTSGNCDQCGVQGTCQSADETVNDGGPTYRRCKCTDGQGNRAADTCSGEVAQSETGTTVSCINGGVHCECHQHDTFYMGQIPGCNPTVAAPLPLDYAAVCECTGKEDSDNH